MKEDEGKLILLDRFSQNLEDEYMDMKSGVDESQIEKFEMITPNIGAVYYRTKKENLNCI
jgi:hypothetical protein